MCTLVQCEDCGARGHCDPENLMNEGYYECPKECGGMATYVYYEADHKCPNCKKLGNFPDSVQPCCSRVCKLQTEYAAELAAMRA